MYEKRYSIKFYNIMPPYEIKLMYIKVVELDKLYRLGNVKI